MPIIEINGETVEGRVGDNLLALARRKALHIWFVCDGRGLCRTCECHVISGAEYLSRPSRIELDAIGESRCGSGYRLACQTRVAGDGAVKMTSLSEEIRRQAADLVKRPEGSHWLENAGRLIGNLARFTLDFTRSIPSLALNALPQMVTMPPDISGMQKYFRDTQRVVERVLRQTRGSGDSTK